MRPWLAFAGNCGVSKSATLFASRRMRLYPGRAGAAWGDAAMNGPGAQSKQQRRNPEPPVRLGRSAGQHGPGLKPANARHVRFASAGHEHLTLSSCPPSPKHLSNAATLAFTAVSPREEHHSSLTSGLSACPSQGAGTSAEDRPPPSLRAGPSAQKNLPGPLAGTGQISSECFHRPRWQLSGASLRSSNHRHLLRLLALGNEQSLRRSWHKADSA